MPLTDVVTAYRRIAPIAIRTSEEPYVMVSTTYPR